MNKCKEKQKTTGGYEYGKNKIYRAEIVGYASEGSSIARIQDMVVFVPSGAVGDHAVVGSDRIYSYRNKAQYPVGRTEGGVVTGFYRVRSHDIIPVDRCLIQTEQADTLAKIVRE